MNQTNVRYYINAGWLTLVLIGGIAPALLLGDRLPDPMATHGGGGGEPDGFTSRGVAAIMLPLVFVGVGVGLALLASLNESRGGPYGAIIGSCGAVTLAVQTVTVYANYDRENWQDARPVRLAPLIIVVAGALVFGAIGAVVDRRMASAQAGAVAAVTRVPPLDLAPAEQALWIGHASNAWLLVSGTSLVVAAAVATRFPGAVTLPDSWWGIALLFLVGLVVLLFSVVRCQADERGVRVAYGPWGWPVQRIAPSKIAAAEVAQLSGKRTGWGYRGRPGKAALIVRSGECPLLRYASGGWFYISIDDATNGAALINAYRARAMDREASGAG